MTLLTVLSRKAVTDNQWRSRLCEMGRGLASPSFLSPPLPA